MAKFRFEITRRVAITFGISVSAKDEDDAQEKLDQMIADNDPKLNMDQVQIIVGGGWSCDEDDIEAEPV